MYESDMSASFSGTVNGGEFNGLNMKATVTLTPADGNCTTTPVTQLSFVGSVKIK